MRLCQAETPAHLADIVFLALRFGLLPLSMTSTRKAKATSRGVETEAQVSEKRLSWSFQPLPNSAPKPPPALLEMTN